MMNLHQNLIQCGMGLFARKMGKKPDAQAGLALDIFTPYFDSLGNGKTPESQLSSIFSHIGEGKPPVMLPLKPLALEEEIIFPAAPGAPPGGMEKLWEGFQKETRALLPRGEMSDEERFEAFFHLMRKYAWSLPCEHGEPGVSLFEQFKAVCALACAAGEEWKNGPSQEMKLVGGDIPGIQNFVFTISSKGAAKGLRGRSFFVQLLGDAVVQAVLREFSLTSANIIYAAGGNFMLLAPGDDKTKEKLASLRQKLEVVLFETFQADLSICLEWVELPLGKVSTKDFADPVSRRLKERIASRKQQAVSGLAQTHWESLFTPSGKVGDRRCVICQRPLAANEVLPNHAEVEQEQFRCQTCDGFRDLAEKIGQSGELLLVMGQTPPAGASGPSTWQDVLHRISGWWYGFEKAATFHPEPGSRCYLINSTRFLERGAHGFRFIARSTPHVTRAEADNWTPVEGEEDDKPSPGSIRTFSQMADLSEGVKRVGVLRMDVDNLGRVMTSGLQNRSMAATSALSWSLDLFFSGWLNPVCDAVNGNFHATHDNGSVRGERLYTIYAGGDDLFIVGSWDLMPELAYRLQKNFTRYAGLTISAGITLEDRKFPLYQAAERAGDAEKAAKDHKRHAADRDKDALCFLGIPVKWEDWGTVAGYCSRIMGAIGEEKAPQALIHILLNIYEQYIEQRKALREKKQQEALQENKSGDALREAGKQKKDDDGGGEQMPYGPWMWRRAYALSRMAERVKDPEARADIAYLQEACLKPGHMHFIGLAARWAELLTRKEGGTNA